MYRTSKNVIFVYGLLLIDLLVNITDNLVPGASRWQSYYLLPTRPEQSGPQRLRRVPIVSSLIFATIVVQILAIIMVIISLTLRFFDVADGVRQSAWLVTRRRRRRRGGRELVEGATERHAEHAASNRWDDKLELALAPMAQRTALKLVLHRFWWSLVVGLTYLVLTIILHINKLDGRQKWPATIENKPKLADWNADDDEKRRLEGPTETWPPEVESQGDVWPILIVLIHKLMSTCYYVSFVVVYRASLSQMVNRVLATSDKQPPTASSSQFVGV